MRESLKRVKRLVVKVGSSLVTQSGTEVNKIFVETLADQMARLKSRGYELLLVTSGAVAVGMGRLQWSSRPQQLHQLQAAAAMGQVQLAQCYEACFARYGWPTAQVLLTHDDLRDRTRYLNARSTLNTLLELGVLPIINENDVVASEEIRFGDNDTLAAMVVNLMESDLLVLLTDRPGMFSADPRKDAKAQLLSEVKAEDMSLEEMAGGVGSGIGKGGMITKVRAARRAARSGAHTLIAAGMEKDVLPRLLLGENLGTLFVASLPPLAARKQWLADHLSLAGILILDDGAVAALRGGKSLLPVGVRKVEGNFQRGAVLSCQNTSGQEIARGLTNYAMQELKIIASHPSHEIEKLLGYMTESEVIHRDNLVMMD